MIRPEPILLFLLSQKIDRIRTERRKDAIAKQMFLPASRAGDPGASCESLVSANRTASACASAAARSSCSC